MISAAEVAKATFRLFSQHMNNPSSVCGDPKAYRDHDKNRSCIYCRCGETWVFSDAALRDAPHILDYLSTCDERLREPILNFQPRPGAWARVLLGFLDESEAQMPENSGYLVE